VPQIERKIRQVKERVRSHISVLPYNLTMQLTVGLVQFCTQSINVLPQSTREHKISPKELFTGKKINYHNDLKITFGEYVQINEDNIISKNSMKERTADAIALRMKGNAQGSAEFLSLNSWRVVSRDRWTVLPMPQAVIDKINKKAELEKRSNLMFNDNETIPNKNSSLKDQILVEEFLPKTTIRVMPHVENEINNETLDDDILNEPVHLDQVDNKIISEELSISRGDDSSDNSEKNQDNLHKVNESRDQMNLDEVYPNNEEKLDNIIHENPNRYNFRQKRAQMGDFERMYHVKGELALALHVSIKQGLKEFG
jgi:hypothetical protein